MRSTFRDGLSFLRKATPRRVLNAGQVVASYVLSRLTGRARAWGLPVALAFEPTTMPSDYAELHCLSNFSFQRGASTAQELFERARKLVEPAQGTTTTTTTSPAQGGQR